MFLAKKKPVKMNIKLQTESQDAIKLILFSLSFCAIFASLTLLDLKTVNMQNKT
jgi:hypothetical protein